MPINKAIYCNLNGRWGLFKGFGRMSRTRRLQCVRNVKVTCRPCGRSFIESFGQLRACKGRVLNKHSVCVLPIRSPTDPCERPTFATMFRAKKPYFSTIKARLLQARARSESNFKFHRSEQKLRPDFGKS